jgi:hypothetical protein
LTDRGMAVIAEDDSDVRHITSLGLALGIGSLRWGTAVAAVGPPGPGRRRVTERPFQLGDTIYEFVRTPTGPQEVEWHITEHDRPHHAKLQAEDGTTITYTFTGKGDDTSFRRVFELGPVLGAQQPPPYTSDTARAENANVKALVEKILWREQKGRNLP